MKKTNEIFTIICRGLLILLFSYASVSKVVKFPRFKEQMLNQPFPDWMGWMLLVIVPVSEIVISIMLMSDKRAKKALLYSSILMSAFTSYVSVILMHAFRYVPCSCGGVLEKLTWKQHLWFNIFFTVLAVFGFIYQKRVDKSVTRSSSSPTQLAGL